jgi:hypothetical protein
MDISRIGTLFIIGPERFIAGNDIVFTAVFKEPFAQAELFNSYRESVLKHSAMHSMWVGLNKKLNKERIGLNKEVADRPVSEAKESKSTALSAPVAKESSALSVPMASVPLAKEDSVLSAIEENKKRCAWKPFPPEKLEELLLYEKGRIERRHDLNTVYSEYCPTNERLPFRLTPINERILVLSLNHSYSNGRGALTWIEEWLRCYAKAADVHKVHEPDQKSDWLRCHANEAGINLPSLMPGTNLPSLMPGTNLPNLMAGAGFSGGDFRTRPPGDSSFHGCNRRKGIKKLKCLFWTTIYLLSFLWRSGRTASAETVDLTHGQQPGEHGSGYRVRTYIFSPEETAKVIRKSKIMGQTVSEFLCAAIAKIFFKAQPERNRLCISVPVDLRPELRQGTHCYQATPCYQGMSCYQGIPCSPGNYTGSLIIQLFRHENIDRQTRDAFVWAKRKVPYGLVRLVSLTAPYESKLKERFEKQAARPIPARAPLENFTFAFSNLGIINSPILGELIERISVHGKTQTVFFGILTFNDRLTIEVCIANDLFQPDEVFRLTDQMMDII